MTQTPRKPAANKVVLQPNQIYIKRPGCAHPIQTLIEGYPDWSYADWGHGQYSSLYYKGSCIDLFSPRNYEKRLEMIRLYQHSRQYQLEAIDRINEKDGLQEWCLRESFKQSRLKLCLSLPEGERNRLEEVAKAASHSSLEEVALKALYMLLPELETLYADDLKRLKQPEEDK